MGCNATISVANNYICMCTFFFWVGVDLADFSRVFSILFWELHFVEKGFKNSCSRFFLKFIFFSVFYTYTYNHKGSLGGKVGGW